MPQCTAKSKRSGQQCKKDAVIGSNPSSPKCHIHGGKTPRGIGSPNFKHGRYSKCIPSQLSEEYTALMTDPYQLATREEIALVEARLWELISTCDEGESGESWKQLKKLKRAFQKTKNDNKQSLIIDQMFAIIDNESNSATWGEIVHTIDHKRKLVKSERQRSLQAKKTITIEQAMTLVSAILSVIKAHVTDRKTLAKISSSIRQLISSPLSG